MTPYDLAVALILAVTVVLALREHRTTRLALADRDLRVHTERQKAAERLADIDAAIAKANALSGRLDRIERQVSEVDARVTAQGFRRTS